MSAWAKRRQAIFILSFSAVFLVVALVLSFFVIFPKEEVIEDISGKEPTVAWSVAKETAGGIYNASAYLFNTESNLSGIEAHYRFVFLNNDGEYIGEREGRTFFERSSDFIVFEDRIPIEEDVGHTVFEWIDISWIEGSLHEFEYEYVLDSEKLVGLDDRPRLEARVQNTGDIYIPALELVALIKDYSDNIVGLSRTISDGVDFREERNITFTWPEMFELEEVACSALYDEAVFYHMSLDESVQHMDVILIIDRSGSMAADQANPPEPLTSVKEAAKNFIDSFRGEDRVSIISFATEASLDSPLSFGFDEVKEAIDSIRILFDEGTQFTNTGESLEFAYKEFQKRERDESYRMIVFLTDGERPNRPLMENDPDYPSTYAFEEAGRIKDDNIELYTIGLGEQFDGSFLKELATSPEHFFEAPTTDFLEDIYSEITCKVFPSKIEIISRVVPR